MCWHQVHQISLLRVNLNISAHKYKIFSFFQHPHVQSKKESLAAFATGIQFTPFVSKPKIILQKKKTYGKASLCIQHLLGFHIQCFRHKRYFGNIGSFPVGGQQVVAGHVR